MSDNSQNPQSQQKLMSGNLPLLYPTYAIPPMYPFFNPFFQPPPPQTKTIGKYEFSFDRRLGEGLTSEAYIGVNKETSEQVCIKIIDRLKFKNQQQLKLMENQIKCQEKLNSDFTVKIFDVYDTNSFCFIVTELCEGGDLFKILKYSKGGLSDEFVIKFAYDIAQALLKMKESKIIHRDLKSENILIQKGRAKVGDFGFSIQQENLKEKETLNLGSPLYMSLQALQQNRYSYQSDIFAYGIVLYQLIHSRSPWECQDETQLKNRMKTQEIQFREDVSDSLKSLILGCLQRNADQRTKIEQLVNLEIFESLREKYNKIESQIVEEDNDKNSD